MRITRRYLLAGIGSTTAAFATSGRISAYQTTLSANQQVRDVGHCPPLHPLTQQTPDGFAALMTYDPTREPDAAYFRSRVPIALRIRSFAATQAHSALDPRPGVASLSGAYGGLDPDHRDDFRKVRYGSSPKAKLHVARMFAYHDIVVGWEGTGTIPNPALVDVAHRNGALCLGTIFQPDARLYDGSVVPIEAVAAKLVALAGYFGYDGYFLNFEGGTEKNTVEVLELARLMRREANRRKVSPFIVQYYDGGTNVAKLLRFQRDVAGSGDRPIVDSAMLDQGWSAYGGPGGCCSGRPVEPSDVATYCREHSLDPYTSAYFGFQLYPGPGYLGAVAGKVIQPNDGTHAYGSLQIYSAEDGMLTMKAALRDHARRAGLPLIGAADERARLYRIERMFYSGQSQNPARLNAPDADQLRAYAPTRREFHLYADYSSEEPRARQQVALPITYGIANFVAERSTVGSLPFATRFNTGEGDVFFEEGVQVCDTPWFNIGVQDVLPTWQWRVEPLHGVFAPVAGEDDLLSVDFDMRAAFAGPASLRITGVLAAGKGARVWLYKTALVLDRSDTHAQVVWRADLANRAAAKLGLVFADAPADPVWTSLLLGINETIAVGPAGIGWLRSRIALTPHHGRTIAAILFGLEAAGDEPLQADVAIGELYVGSLKIAPRPATPTGFMVERSAYAANSGVADIGLQWQYDKRMAYYDVFRADSRREGRTWLGRIDGDRYYLPRVPLDARGRAHFELVAVARDAPLSPSDPARLVFDSRRPARRASRA